MQDQDFIDVGEAEVERVRRHVIAVHERIRAITPVSNESTEAAQTYK